MKHAVDNFKSLPVAQTLFDKCSYLIVLQITTCFESFPSAPSPRPGVPLGAEAICGGGGRPSAQEQQAHN